MCARFDAIMLATRLLQKRISRLHRLLKGGAAAAQRAAAAKAPVEAAGEALIPPEVAQTDTNGTAAASASSIIPSPLPGGRPPGLHPSPAPATVATPAADRGPKQLQAYSTFSTRANEINSRGVRAVVARLGAIGSELEVERAWAVDDRKPGGGMHEFRASVFNRKLGRLFKRCEEAHEEADAVSEAYLLLVDRGR